MYMPLSCIVWRAAMSSFACICGDEPGKAMMPTEGIGGEAFQATGGGRDEGFLGLWRVWWRWVTVVLQEVVWRWLRRFPLGFLG